MCRWTIWSAEVKANDEMTRTICPERYQRIRDLREDADLNQTQVAKFLGMSQTGYSKYETGENDIPTQVLIKLVGFYKTSTDYILGISDRRDPV